MSLHWKEEEFLEYFDGRAAPETRLRLEAHLAECADCRRQLEELRALGSVLREWTPAPVSAGFDSRLRARLAEEPAAPKGLLVLRPSFALGLAAAAALVAAVMLWQPSGPEVTQVKPQAPTVTAPGPDAVAPPVLPGGREAGTRVAEDLVVLENPVLLSDYELLEEFDVLFEPLEKENGKSL